MRTAKYITSIIMSIILCLGLFHIPTSAQEVYVYGETVEEINNKSDEELIDFIAEKVAAGTPFSEIQSEFSKADVEIFTPSSNQATTRASISSDATLTLYGVKRGGEGYYHLTAQVVANKSLASSCGTEDIISVEWNTKQATYYSNNAGTNTTYMDGSKRSKGIILFNLQDSKMTKGKSAHCTALVTPKSGKKKIDFASKYIHTYNKTNYTWSIGGNVKYKATDKNWSGGMTFKVTGTAKENKWQLYYDNTLYL